MTPKFFRKRNIIQADGKNTDYPSINAAKRESKRLQKQHGHGSLMVVETLPVITQEPA